MMTIQNISRRILLVTLAVIVLVSTTTTAFAPPATSLSFSTAPTAATTTTTTITGVNSSTRLLERKWNFNEGQSPWGMKQNAETWNGRVAQVCVDFFNSKRIEVMKIDKINKRNGIVIEMD